MSAKPALWSDWSFKVWFSMYVDLFKDFLMSWNNCDFVAPAGRPKIGCYPSYIPGK